MEEENYGDVVRVVVVARIMIFFKTLKMIHINVYPIKNKNEINAIYFEVIL